MIAAHPKPDASKIEAALAKLGGAAPAEDAGPDMSAANARLAALRDAPDYPRMMAAAFRERRDVIVERLNAMPGVECLPTDGTFYVFPSVRGLIDAIDGVQDDLQLAEHLIVNAGVALVPGTAFGLGGHARISIATSMENLENALDRIEKAIA